VFRVVRRSRCYAKIQLDGETWGVVLATKWDKNYKLDNADWRTLNRDMWNGRISRGFVVQAGGGYGGFYEFYDWMEVEKLAALLSQITPMSDQYGEKFWILLPGFTSAEVISLRPSKD
jgi:hypothetical protein